MDRITNTPLDYREYYDQDLNVTWQLLESQWDLLAHWTLENFFHLILTIALWGRHEYQDFIYRHILFYCALLYSASQILCFLPIEGLWQPCVQQVYRCHFSSSICSLHVSVPHFGNSRNISNFLLLLYLLWWSVISDLWCYYYNLLKPQMMVSMFQQ